MAGKPDPQASPQPQAQGPAPAGLHNVLVYVSSDNFAAYAVNHHHHAPPPPQQHHGHHHGQPQHHAHHHGQPPPQHVYCQQNGAQPGAAQPGFCVAAAPAPAPAPGKGRLLAASQHHASFAAPPLPLNGLVPPPPALYGAAPGGGGGSPGPGAVHNGFPPAQAEGAPLPPGLCLLPACSSSSPLVLGGKLVAAETPELALPPAAAPGPAAGPQRAVRGGGEAEGAPRCDSVRSETSCSSLSSGSADSQPDGAAPVVSISLAQAQPQAARPPPPPPHQQQQLILAVHPHPQHQQVQSVAPPLGWKRLHISGSIVYVSPSNTALSSLELLKDYLQTQGTCKCGLECPLQCEQVFNFDPKDLRMG